MRFFQSLLFSLIVLIILAVSPASAAQTGVLLPATAGNYQQWTPSTGANHQALVDEAICNGATDYNSETTVGQRDSYGISVSPIPDGATITQIAITPCASRNSTGGAGSTFNVFYRLNGSDSSDAGAYALANNTTPAVLSTTSFSGLSVTKSPTTIVEVGGVYSSGNRGVRLSQMATQITYTPLSTPSALTALGAPAGVTLNWNDTSSNEDGFKIERLDSGSFVQIATVAANVHTYLDPVSLAGTYTYRVRGYNSGGNTTYTFTATAFMITAPSALDAIATGTTINLTWVDNATNEAGFRIEIATGAGSFAFYKNVNANVATASATSLSPNTYSFRVRAFTGSNVSEYSNTDDATVLAAPSGLGTTVVGADVTLDWTDNSGTEDGFRIERSDNGGAFTEIGTVGADVLTYFDPSLASGNYDYRVRAYKASDTSSYSASSSALVL